MRRDAALGFSMHLWHIMRGHGLCSCLGIVLCSLCARPTPTPTLTPHAAHAANATGDATATACTISSDS